MNILLLALGGALGTTMRYFVQIFFARFTHSIVGTLIVNISGCLLIGLLYALLERLPQGSTGHQSLHHFFVVGLCGGYTTFSTFGYEGLTLLDRGEMVVFVLYTFGSLALGILACLLGMLLGRAL